MHTAGLDDWLERTWDVPPWSGAEVSDEEANNLLAANAALGAAGELRIGFGGRRWDGGFRALLDDLVGQKQCREQELPCFGQCAEPGERFAALAIDETGSSAQILLFALAAGDLVGAPRNGEIDHRRH